MTKPDKILVKEFTMDIVRVSLWGKDRALFIINFHSDSIIFSAEGKK